MNSAVMPAVVGILITVFVPEVLYETENHPVAVVLRKMRGSLVCGGDPRAQQRVHGELSSLLVQGALSKMREEGLGGGGAKGAPVSDDPRDWEFAWVEYKEVVPMD